MAVHFFKNLTVFRISASFTAAALSILGTAAFLEGPRLGPYYDFLLRCRLETFKADPALSAEITLIETGGEGERRGDFFFRNFIEAETAASVLMTLTEFEAAGLVLRLPLLGAGGMEEGGAELNRRFEEEFGLLEGNIRSFFEAIRLGSIPPAEAEAYVGELIRLTEGGKERLLAFLFREDGSRPFERARAAFGRDRIAAAAPEREGEAGERTDPDGVLRRIRPLSRRPGEGEGWEHPVYTLIKRRYDKAELLESPAGARLCLVKDGQETIIPLDSSGAILVEGPRGEGDFRRLSLSSFARYETADRELYEAISAASALAVYGGLNPEAYPPILYEYARSLREELLRSPNGERRSRWRAGREAYAAALEDLCYGPWEMRLVSSYEERIAAGGPEDLQEERDEVIRAFVGIREKYRNFVEIREALRLSLVSSLCILGPGEEAAPFPDIRASGLLASSLLSGKVIRPVPFPVVLLASLGIALAVAFALLPLEGPLLSAGAGFFLTILAGALFSWLFVLNSFWIDPLIPSSAALAAALASSLFAALLRFRLRGRLRRAYGAVLPPPSLTALLRGGAAPSTEPRTSYAVIAAVRSGAMMEQENRGDREGMARAAAAFREELFRWCAGAGGIIAGWEGDAALIAFGAPLERDLLGPKGCPGAEDDGALASRAVGLIRVAAESGAWYFGVDAGPCAFAYTPDAGYRVYGSPAVRARVLSVLAFRYRLGVLLTAAVKEGAAPAPSRQLKLSLGKKSPEIFYALLPLS